MNGNSKHLTGRASARWWSAWSCCQPIVDMRPVGWMVAAFGLAVGCASHQRV